MNVSQHAKGPDPKAPPLIDPAYLSNKADMQLLVESVRFARKIVKAEPLASLVTARVDPSDDVLEDTRKLEKYVKTTFETAHHPVGTAAMMPKDMGGKVHRCHSQAPYLTTLLPFVNRRRRSQVEGVRGEEPTSRRC